MKIVRKFNKLTHFAGKCGSGPNAEPCETLECCADVSEVFTVSIVRAVIQLHEIPR
jgi:hypothetical protein